MHAQGLFLVDFIFTQLIQTAQIMFVRWIVKRNNWSVSRITNRFYSRDPLDPPEPPKPLLDNPVFMFWLGAAIGYYGGRSKMLEPWESQKR